MDIFAKPKSPIFTSNFLLMNIFSNFKSLCTISASWSAFNPSAIYLKYFFGVELWQIEIRIVVGQKILKISVHTKLSYDIGIVFGVYLVDEVDYVRVIYFFKNLNFPFNLRNIGFISFYNFYCHLCLFLVIDHSFVDL